MLAMFDMDFQSDSYESRGVVVLKKRSWDHSATPISILNWKNDARTKNGKYFLTGKVCLSATETDF